METCKSLTWFCSNLAIEETLVIIFPFPSYEPSAKYLNVLSSGLPNQFFFSPQIICLHIPFRFHDVFTGKITGAAFLVPPFDTVDHVILCTEPQPFEVLEVDRVYFFIKWTDLIIGNTMSAALPVTVDWPQPLFCLSHIFKGSTTVVKTL